MMDLESTTNEEEEELEKTTMHIDFSPLDSVILPNFWKKFDELKVDKVTTKKYNSHLYNYNRFFQ
jgi:hypothetical protein